MCYRAGSASAIASTVCGCQSINAHSLRRSITPSITSSRSFKDVVLLLTKTLPLLRQHHYHCHSLNRLYHHESHIGLARRICGIVRYGSQFCSGGVVFSLPNVFCRLAWALIFLVRTSFHHQKSDDPVSLRSDKNKRLRTCVEYD